MRHVCALLLFASTLSVPAFAEGTSRGEIFVGYSYLSADTNGLTSRQNIPYGINVSFVGNVNQWVGAETNAAAYYKKISGVDLYDYSLVFGPRIHYKWSFVHLLVGMDDLAARAGGLKANQASPAAVVGGGAMFSVYRHIGVEGSGDYAFSHHNIVGGPGVTQNNFRVAAGIVFMFGHTGATADQKAQPLPSHSQTPTHIIGAGMRIPALGIMVFSGRNGGAEITEIGARSVAESAGIHVGDVINAVDGKPVKTPTELAAAFSGIAPGSKVRIGYMVRGQWQTETVVILGGS